MRNKPLNSKVNLGKSRVPSLLTNPNGLSGLKVARIERLQFTFKIQPMHWNFTFSISDASNTFRIWTSQIQSNIKHSYIFPAFATDGLKFYGLWTFLLFIHQEYCAVMVVRKGFGQLKAELLKWSSCSWKNTRVFRP